MLIRKLEDCQEFKSGDSACLRETLHPTKDNLAIRYSLAHAKVESGHSTRPHSLKTSEVYYILEGKGLMHIDSESTPVTKGCTIYIPPKAKQHIENTGKSDLKFLCIVDPAWKIEDEEVF